MSVSVSEGRGEERRRESAAWWIAGAPVRPVGLLYSERRAESKQQKQYPHQAAAICLCYSKYAVLL